MERGVFNVFVRLVGLIKSWVDLEELFGCWVVFVGFEIVEFGCGVSLGRGVVEGIMVGVVVVGDDVVRVVVICGYDCVGVVDDGVY